MIVSSKHKWYLKFSGINGHLIIHVRFFILFNWNACIVEAKTVSNVNLTNGMYSIQHIPEDKHCYDISKWWSKQKPCTFLVVWLGIPLQYPFLVMLYSTRYFVAQHFLSLFRGFLLLGLSFQINDNQWQCQYVSSD